MLSKNLSVQKGFVLILFAVNIGVFYKTDRHLPIRKISTCKAGLPTSEGKSIPPKVFYGSQEGGRRKGAVVTSNSH
jgi:hypothetical protein